MRQTISAVIEHTTKQVLEDRARLEGMPLSRYIRKVLEDHERAEYKSSEDRAVIMKKILEDYDK